MSDREELADAIMSTHRVERHPELRRANSLVEADGVLASPWLTRHDDEVTAIALKDAAEALSGIDPMVNDIMDRLIAKVAQKSIEGASDD